jgi:hypothetical protein
MKDSRLRLRAYVRRAIKEALASLPTSKGFGPAYERGHARSIPVHAQPAVVLATVKDEPSDGSAGGRTKESSEGGQHDVRSDTLILSPHLSTKPGQVQSDPDKRAFAGPADRLWSRRLTMREER